MNYEFLEKYEHADEARLEHYVALAKAVGVPEDEDDKARRHWFWYRVDITEKEGVVRVYLDDKLAFTELEDRFPTKENVARLLLLAL